MKIAMACAGLAVIGLLSTTITASQAEEHGEMQVATTVGVADATPKKEALDAMATGTKGVTEGVILSKDTSESSGLPMDGA